MKLLQIRVESERRWRGALAQIPSEFSEGLRKLATSSG